MRPLTESSCQLNTGRRQEQALSTFLTGITGSVVDDVWGRLGGEGYGDPCGI